MELRSKTAREVVRRAAAELDRSHVPEPAASAEILLAELLGTGRAEVLVDQSSLSEEQLATYEAYISRRKNREPVQRILGYAYFRYLKLRLNDATLVPRPDTESVVGAALEVIDRGGGRCRVLDLGTGSGAIAISIAQERPPCEVYATDSSEAALEVARRNAETTRTDVMFCRADLLSGLEDLREEISLLVSNPPYVKSKDLSHLAPEVWGWDPHLALDGGPDGLSFYRQIFAEAGPLLETGASLVLEVGDGQEEAVTSLGRAAGFIADGTRKDLTGTARAVLLRWRG